jgi:citrate synthase
MYDAVNVDSSINMTADRLWMPAPEAARVLGVNRATLYAYVSRGYVRSQAMPGRARQRGYSREDVEKHRRRTEERRSPDKAASRALQWGMPVLESAITLIDGETLYYRGHDARILARTRSLEEVASLIWTGRFDVSFASTCRGVGVGAHRRLPFAARAQAMLAAAAAADRVALDLRAESVARCGWRILHLLTAAATSAASRECPRVRHMERPRSLVTPDEALAGAWGVRTSGADLIRTALILCADHELNVSSFVARCVASAGSNPYAVVIAALSALEGPKHGGAGARVAAMLQTLRTSRDIGAALAARLGRGEPIDGFGHPLYQGGDPRAAMLLDLLRERFPRSAELAFIGRVADEAAHAIGAKPNLDFSLAAIARLLKLPDGAPLMLFATGRTVGWIGHAIEQYASDRLIRPRAKYVGVVPTPT